MTDFSPSPAGNVAEFTVSELSLALKRTVEENYSHVRVRGEISGFKRAASGHLYMALKDENAVLDAVCWRGTAQRLAIRPEDGLEVVATGRLTTYPGRSKYQIVIESLELAGEGALLKLLEERRRRLAAEGLFDEVRKKPLPFLPDVIGVVTSPTGAVIRDILHRLQDRFPRRVLLWPVLVQGEGAAEQVAAAIAGFNALVPGGPVPRPDVLIVARGGGSLEDLWAFNEEVVVRAAAASAIPLISAVGHETDTTLIDFAADRRAPTPTAAAEMAVPVRAELLADVLNAERRLVGAAGRLVSERRVRVEGLARGLPTRDSILAVPSQRLDAAAERLASALRAFVVDRRHATAALGARLRHPKDLLADLAGRLRAEARLLDASHRGFLRRERQRLSGVAVRLSDHGIRRGLDVGRRDLAAIWPRLNRLASKILQDQVERTARIAGLLESISPKRVLERGYVAVLDAFGAPVMDAAATSPGQEVSLQFRDGRVGAVIADAPPAKPSRKAAPAARSDDKQGSLL